jgi:hypothetical protein
MTGESHTLGLVRFALTDKVANEARRFALRSACGDCRYHSAARDRCANEWPNEMQKRWPIDAPDASGNRPETVDFCREFELR